MFNTVSGFSKDDGQYQNCGRAVAFGYWGRHDVIKNSETDFLWVKKCFIKSNIPGHDPVELVNCLVDTGSEVVTIQQDIMSELNLTFLQTVSSRGIHKAKEKPLYSAVMLLGNNVIEVKVSPCKLCETLLHPMTSRVDLLPSIIPKINIKQHGLR